MFAWIGLRGEQVSIGVLRHYEENSPIARLYGHPGRLAVRAAGQSGIDRNTRVGRVNLQ